MNEWAPASALLGAIDYVEGDRSAERPQAEP
jgi:hypothetical protein